jgi:hypothetical protein
MKRKNLILIVMLLLVSFVLFVMLYKSPVINEYKNIADMQVERAYLVVAKKYPTMISPGGKINYKLIRRLYPSAKLAVVAGYSAGESGYPVGLCVEDGRVINKSISFDMGLLLIQTNSHAIIMTHGKELLNQDNLSYLYGGSVLQLQSLIRKSDFLELNNDVIEHHWILMKKDKHYSIHYEYDKLSRTIDHLKKLKVSRAFKLGGGSANACAIFNKDGTITRIGETNNSPFVVAVLVFM